MHTPEIDSDANEILALLYTSIYPSRGIIIHSVRESELREKYRAECTCEYVFYIRINAQRIIFICRLCNNNWINPYDIPKNSTIINLAADEV